MPRSIISSCSRTSSHSSGSRESFVDNFRGFDINEDDSEYSDPDVIPNRRISNVSELSIASHQSFSFAGRGNSTEGDYSLPPPSTQTSNRPNSPTVARRTSRSSELGQPYEENLQRGKSTVSVLASLRGISSTSVNSLMSVNSFAVDEEYSQPDGDCIKLAQPLDTQARSASENKFEDDQGHGLHDDERILPPLPEVNNFSDEPKHRPPPQPPTSKSDFCNGPDRLPSLPRADFYDNEQNQNDHFDGRKSFQNRNDIGNRQPVNNQHRYSGAPTRSPSPQRVYEQNHRNSSNNFSNFGNNNNNDNYQNSNSRYSNHAGDFYDNRSNGIQHSNYHNVPNGHMSPPRRAAPPRNRPVSLIDNMNSRHTYSSHDYNKSKSQTRHSISHPHPRHSSRNSFQNPVPHLPTNTRNRCQTDPTSRKIRHTHNLETFDEDDTYHEITTNRANINCWEQYFHGDLPRQQADQVLRNQAPGSFLFRKSTRDQSIVMTVMGSSVKCSHIKISTDMGSFCGGGGEPEFADIDSLMDYYTNESPLKCERQNGSLILHTFLTKGMPS